MVRVTLGVWSHPTEAEFEPFSSSSAGGGMESLPSPRLGGADSAVLSVEGALLVPPVSRGVLMVTSPDGDTLDFALLPLLTSVDTLLTSVDFVPVSLLADEDMESFDSVAPVLPSLPGGAVEEAWFSLWMKL